MKGYLITDSLRKQIRSNKCSLEQISKILGFQVKNICNHNLTINENHLKKLRLFLNLDLNLKEFKFDYSKNLGKYAISKTIRPIKKGKNLSEFIGIMLGDGNLYLDQLKIAFDKREGDYINYVENLCKNLFEIKLKKKVVKETNQAYLYFYSKNLINKLLEFGLMRGDKIKNQIGIPQWIKENESYSKNCIKGLIDTDGCIYVCKRERQKYIKFTNFNRELLKDFKEITRNLGYSFAKANKRNVCLYRKKEVVKFINEIQPNKSNKYGVVG